MQEQGTTWEEITELEGHLEGLKHSYEAWTNVVTKTTLQGQLQMMKRDCQMGLDILDLVQEEPKHSYVYS